MRSKRAPERDHPQKRERHLDGRRISRGSDFDEEDTHLQARRNTKSVGRRTGLYLLRRSRKPLATVSGRRFLPPLIESVNAASSGHVERHDVGQASVLPPEG